MDVFKFIVRAITIAALNFRKDFLSQRDHTGERLLSRETARDGGDRVAASKESKANGDRGNAAHDVVSMKYSQGEAEAFNDDMEENSQVVGQVLRIKRVLDNSRHESDSELHESLRRLRSMSIIVDILEVRLKFYMEWGWKAMVEEICRRTVDVADPCNIVDGTISSVKNENIRKPGQEKYDFNQAGSLASRKRRLNVNQHKGNVKPNMFSNANSRTIPPSESASRKFEKERMLQSQDSNGSVAGCKRPLASRRDMIKCWNEVVADMKYEATKRKT